MSAPSAERRRILVTGATGFIGTHLVEALRHDHNVVALARAGQPALPGVTWVIQDLAAPLALGELRPDILVHLAQANGSDELQAINAHSTEKLLAYGRDQRIARFILASTANVYGFGPQPFAEEDPIAPESSAYAASKVAAETAAWRYRGDFDVAVLRLGAPYGPGQQATRMIPAIAGKVRRGEPVQLNNAAGNPRITPTYVGDLVAILERLALMPGSRMLNVAGPEHCSVRDIAQRAGEVFGIEPAFEVADAPAVGDLMLDTARMHELGLSAPTALAEGLRRTFATS